MKYLPLLALLVFGCGQTPDTKPPAAPTTQANAPKAAPGTAAETSGPPKVLMPMVCTLGPCHGLDDLTCTKGPPMECTAMYKMGDFCRSFVKCEMTQAGECGFTKAPEFERCKACMATCKDPMKCEAKCRAELGVE